MAHVKCSMLLASILTDIDTSAHHSLAKPSTLDSLTSRNWEVCCYLCSRREVSRVWVCSGHLHLRHAAPSLGMEHSGILVSEFPHLLGCTAFHIVSPRAWQHGRSWVLIPTVDFGQVNLSQPPSRSLHFLLAKWGIATFLEAHCRPAIVHV